MIAKRKVMENEHKKRERERERERESSCSCESFGERNCKEFRL